MTPLNYSITYILWSDGFRKLACLFAGLGHLQPLLLATTNSHYLLDRFCMERCCSGEYISRIVTSIIFMEILAILVVRIAIYISIGVSTNWSNAENLVSHNKREKPIIDFVSILILCLILLGYIQILYAFTTGGKKGHMHWFYSSLLIQHFLNSLIAGSIGFWEVGRALWYLVTLPLGPVVVFFYQLYIHSWIRNNGPRDAEYIVVKNQITLALFLSCIATIFWTAGYLIPLFSYTPTTQPLNLANPPGTGNIKALPSKPAELKIWSIQFGGSKQTENLTISTNTGTAIVKIHSITVTLQRADPPDVIVYPRITLKPANGNSGWSAKVIASVDKSKNSVIIEITKPAGVTLGTRTVKDAAEVNIDKIALALEHDANIEVTVSASARTIQTETIKGYTCYPENGYYISGTSTGDSVINKLWNEKWDGGRCFYAEYYKDTADNPALLMLCILGNTLTTKYYGTDNGSKWYVITNSVFSTKLDELQRTGSLTSLSGEDATDQSNTQNTYFTKVLHENWNWSYIFTWAFNSPTPTWAPLFMQGLSVGAVGSIFPNLIPKTLTCPKTTRTLSVINMFMVTVPHIFNVMFADNGWPSAACAWTWTEWPSLIWNWSWLLYLFYGMAFLFAIFNIHYPEWKLCCYIRSHGWMPFMMTLSITLIIEILIAIARAGICSQRAAGGDGKKKNHPCLHNKIACLMNLTYIPFWLTTTPLSLVGLKATNE